MTILPAANKALLIAALAAAALLPVVIGGHRGFGLGTTASITIILALGLQVTFGFAGQLSIAVAPVQGIGAYVTAELLVHRGWTFFEALVPAILLAAAIGAVIGMPSLRVRGDVLALVTLGAGEILQSLYLHTQFLTNGYQGIGAIDGVSIAGHTVAEQGLYGVALALVLIAIAVACALRSSPLGRSWMADRDDEMAAAGLGIRSGPLRLLAFAIGAGFAGAAGALYAVQNGFVSSVSFGLQQTVAILLIVLVAGQGHVGRTVAASVAYMALVDRLATRGSVSEGFTGVAILAVVAIRFGVVGAVWHRLLDARTALSRRVRDTVVVE